MFTLNQEYCFITAVGVLGFLLGVLLRNSNFVKKIRRVSLVLIFPITLLLIGYYGCIGGIEVVRQIKISDCDRVINAHFKTQKGRGFSLILSPESLSPPYYVAHVLITEIDSKHTEQFDISSDPIQTAKEQQSIHAQTEYNVVITMATLLPPPSTSVSLKWIQRNWNR